MDDATIGEKIEHAEAVRQLAKRQRLDASLFYWQVSAGVLAGLANGCGPTAIGDLVIPDHLPGGLDLRPACQIHDVDYGHGAISRALADARFAANMLRAMRCTNCSLATRMLQRYWVCRYFDAVDLFGWAFHRQVRGAGGVNGKG
jgi:hypothetical protein